MGGGGASFGTGGMGIGVIVIVLIISYFTGINPAMLLGGAQVLTGNGGGQQVATAPREQHRERRSNVACAAQRPHDQPGAPRARRDRGGVGGNPAGAEGRALHADDHGALHRRPRNPAAAARARRWGRSTARVDKKVYLDTSFFNEMQQKYGGGGDFAYAYVICARNRPSRAGSARHSRPRRRGEAERLAHPGQRDFGPHRVAGRLLRRRLGRQRQQEMEPARTRATSQRAIATAQAIGDDTLAKGGARLRRARQLHPRLLGDAAEMADDGAAKRAGRFLRHGGELTRLGREAGGRPSPDAPCSETSRPRRAPVSAGVAGDRVA